MKIRFFILTIFLVFSLKAREITFSELEKIAQQLPELPKADVNDWTDPDYTSFHKSFLPNVLIKILYKFNLKKPPFINGRDLEILLKKVSANKSRLVPSTRSVVRILVESGTEMYVWGSLHGAWHSLLRDLGELKNKGIISDNLQIIRDDTYFIFIGDALDKSPYSLETLYTLLLLIDRNPDKVIYLRGKYEDKNMWHNYGLVRDVYLRLWDFKKKELDKFVIALDDFFNTLPLAVYLMEAGSPNIIQISQSGREENPEVDIEMMGDVFSSDSNKKLRFYDIKKKKKTESKIIPLVLVRGEKTTQFGEGMQGLELLEPDIRSSAWSVVSSPVPVYQTYAKFYNDTFVRISIKKPLEASIITFFYQDSRQKNGFNQGPEYYLATGQKFTTREEAQSINSFWIGSSLALTKGVFTMGRSVKRGMSLCLQQQNDIGGVHDYIIQPIIYDDQYLAHKARNNIEKFIKENIDTILLPVGSPTLSGYLDLVKKGAITIFFPVTGGPSFRDPALSHIIHFRAAYDDEARALVNYLMTEYSVKKFAFFYQDDSYGRGPLEAAHEFLKKKGISEWLDVPYTRASVDFKRQAQIIKEAQPEAIGLFSTSYATEELFRNIGMDDLLHRSLFGISFLSEANFRKSVREHGLSIIFAQVVPNPETSQLPVVQEYRSIMKSHGHKFDTFSLEAYMATTVFIEALKMLQPPFTAPTILKTLESFNNTTVKGLTLTFNPTKRDLSQSVWLEIPDSSDWLRISLDTLDSTTTTTYQPVKGETNVSK